MRFTGTAKSRIMVSLCGVAVSDPGEMPERLKGLPC